MIFHSGRSLKFCQNLFVLVSIQWKYFVRFLKTWCLSLFTTKSLLWKMLLFAQTMRTIFVEVLNFLTFTPSTVVCPLKSVKSQRGQQNIKVEGLKQQHGSFVLPAYQIINSLISLYAFCNRSLYSFSICFSLCGFNDY